MGNRKWLYDELYDAKFDQVKDEWLESVCTDPECEYCAHRPEKPRQSSGNQVSQELMSYNQSGFKSQKEDL